MTCKAITVLSKYKWTTCLQASMQASTTLCLCFQMFFSHGFLVLFNLFYLCVFCSYKSIWNNAQESPSCMLYRFPWDIQTNLIDAPNDRFETKPLIFLAVNSTESVFGLKTVKKTLNSSVPSWAPMRNLGRALPSFHSLFSAVSHTPILGTGVVIHCKCRTEGASAGLSLTVYRCASSRCFF